MNIIQEFKNDEIDIDSLLFTVFPFGTGNDISFAFNWGRVPPKKMLTDLRCVCQELIDAKEETFDVWEINAQLRPDRGDVRVASGKKLKSLKTKSLTKYMCHSLSFGLDGKIGLNFERKRTSKRGLNNIVYMYEGIKRILN